MTPSDAGFQKFPYPIKKTAANMFLVVVDHIFHTNYRKNCLEFFFPSTTCSSKGWKLDWSSLIKPVIQNGQLYKFGELVLWWFSPGRHFLSNNIHFSNDFATLRCSKFIIFTIFCSFKKYTQKVMPNDAGVCVRKG